MRPDRGARPIASRSTAVPSPAWPPSTASTSVSVTPVADTATAVTGQDRLSTRTENADVGGPPLEAELNEPHGVCVHDDGTLYITDSHNNRVLKIVK